MHVMVPTVKLVDWWQDRHDPHQQIRCICTTGGFCASIESLAKRLGVSHSTIFRRIRTGEITTDEADEWAILVGVHPSRIWNDWDRLRTCSDGPGRNQWSDWRCPPDDYEESPSV